MKPQKSSKRLGVLGKLNIFYSLIKLARRPEDYKSIENFRNSLVKGGYFEFLNEKPFSDINWESISNDTNNILMCFEDSHVPISKTSLKFHFQEFLKTHNLNQSYYRLKKLNFDDKTNIYILRILATHDLWHILYGYSTSQVDEVAHQAFVFQQLRWPTAPFIIGGFILRSAFARPHDLPEIFGKVCKAWFHGKQSPDLFHANFTELLNMDVDHIREKLNIVSFDKFKPNLNSARIKTTTLPASRL